MLVYPECRSQRPFHRRRFLRFRFQQTWETAPNIEDLGKLIELRQPTCIFDPIPDLLWLVGRNTGPDRLMC